MRDFDEFVKIAKTRLKKEIEAGNINKRLMQKFYFQVPKVENNLNNRINARAKRAAEAAVLKTKRDSVGIKHTIRDAKGALKQLGEQPKTQNVLERIKEKATALKNGQRSLDKTIHEAKSRASLSDIGKGNMTLDKYLRASKVDNLRARPMVDSSRGAMKRQGKDIAKTKSIIDRTLPYGMQIQHGGSLDVDDGMIVPSADPKTKRLSGLEVSLPSKDARYIENITTHKFKRLPKLRAREARSNTSGHETLRESEAVINRHNTIDKFGLNPFNPDVAEFASIGSHADPYVLIGDRKYLKQLSPYTQDSNIQMRKALGENRDMNHILLGDKASQSQLKKPFYENIPASGKLDPVKIFTNVAKMNGYDMLSDRNNQIYAKELAKHYSDYKSK